MDELIKNLPEEIQRKIFYMSLEHPTARIMKPMIKEVKNLPKLYLNLETNKLEELGFMGALIGFGYLKDCYEEEHYYLENLLDLLDTF